LSQALAMREMLECQGVMVSMVLVGRSSQRGLPSYFVQAFHASTLLEFQSPNFVKDSKDQGIRLGASLWNGLVNLPTYLREAHKLRKRLARAQVHAVINFYEPLLGLSLGLFPWRIPTVSVAHQYMSLLPGFDMPPKPVVDKIGLKLLTKMSQWGSRELWALSLYPVETHGGKVVVTPPLLRNAVRQMVPSHGEHYLVYLLNSGYAQEVEAWHLGHPETVIHCYWDRTDLPDGYAPRPNLYFHHLDQEGFLRHMASCKALVTTAGFESVSEAVYLGKPVAMVPVKGHYEQKLNSFDALKAQAGVRCDTFDIEVLMALLAGYAPGAESASSRAWVGRSGEVFGGLVQKLCG
jgi:uncharacterized protein (TIGR00661 family)